MKLAVLQHVLFGGHAAIGDWARSHGVSLDITCLFAGAPLPNLSAFDMLAVMGGPMSVNDEPNYPWLSTGLAFVRTAIEDKLLGRVLENLTHVTREGR